MGVLKIHFGQATVSFLNAPFIRRKVPAKRQNLMLATEHDGPPCNVGISGLATAFYSPNSRRVGCQSRAREGSLRRIFGSLLLLHGWGPVFYPARYRARSTSTSRLKPPSFVDRVRRTERRPDLLPFGPDLRLRAASFCAAWGSRPAEGEAETEGSAGVDVEGNSLSASSCAKAASSACGNTISSSSSRSSEKQKNLMYNACERFWMID